MSPASRYANTPPCLRKTAIISPETLRDGVSIMSPFYPLWSIYTHSKLSGKSLEEVAKLVATLYRSNLSISDTATPLQDVNVADLIQRQEEFNRAILKRLEQFEEQQKKRDENLMLALKESIETKK